MADTLICSKCEQPILDAEYIDLGKGDTTHVNACPPEPCHSCHHRQCAATRAYKKRLQAKRMVTITDVYDALLEMTAHLIETHLESGEYDGHGGDADHDGEAPESCSYCESIQKSRELLRGLGVDVSAIEPEPRT